MPIEALTGPQDFIPKNNEAFRERRDEAELAARDQAVGGEPAPDAPQRPRETLGRGLSGR